MLLNPEDYTYQYFQQPRGSEGDSGSIYLAVPKKPNLCCVLIKDYNISDVINEFVGCNIGKRIGVNAPRAWLFKAKKLSRATPINFAHAVGIEFLEDFDERNGGSFETEEMAAQTIRAKLLHILLRDTDQHSLARSNGKIYAFDLADGVYWDNMDDRLLNFFDEWSVGNGFNKHQRIILDQETSARQEMRQYFHNLIEKGISGKLVYSVYSEMREKIISVFEEDGFSGLVEDVREVFSDGVACFVREIIGAVGNTLIDFILPEGEYFLTHDGVLVKEGRVDWLLHAVKENPHPIQVTVVTRPSDSFQGKSSFDTFRAIQRLRDDHAAVVCKEAIHQKFAVIDEKIVWYGSVNLLFFGASQESIIRIVTGSVARTLFKSVGIA